MSANQGLNISAVSYVSQVQDGEVHLVDNGDLDEVKVRELGGRRRRLRSDQWVVPAPDEEALARVLGGLRDAGVPMSGGQGWPPAAVFLQLREAGLLSGPFQEVVWLSPVETQIISHA